MKKMKVTRFYDDYKKKPVLPQDDHVFVKKKYSPVDISDNNG